MYLYTMDFLNICVILHNAMEESSENYEFI